MNEAVEITAYGVENGIAFRLRPILTGSTLSGEVMSQLRAAAVCGYALEHHIGSLSNGQVIEVVYNAAHQVGGIGIGWGATQLMRTKADSALDVVRRFLGGRMENDWTFEDHEHRRRERLECRRPCRWCLARKP